jgi:hypothetical protein
MALKFDKYGNLINDDFSGQTISQAPPKPTVNVGVEQPIGFDMSKISLSPTNPINIGGQTIPTGLNNTNSVATPPVVSKVTPKKTEVPPTKTTPPVPSSTMITTPTGQIDTSQNYTARTNAEVFAEQEKLAAKKTTPIIPPTTPTTTKPSQYDWLSDYQKKLAENQKNIPTLNTPSNVISEYGLTNEQIETQLAQEKAKIEAKYALKRKEAEITTENERMSGLSGLYSTGVVDPRSSGVTSITSAAQKNKEDRLAALNADQMSEEISATERAYGQKEKAAGMKSSYEASVNKTIAEQNELERQAIQDTWTDVSNTISAVKAGRAMSQEDKDAVNTNIKNMLTYAGASAFEGKNAEDLAALEKGAGLTTGSLVGAATYLREQEQLGKKPNIQEVDGSMYDVYYDKDGNLKAKLLVKGTGASEKAPNVQKIDGVDSVWNSATQSFEPVGGGVIDPKKVENAQKAIDLISTMFDEQGNLNPNIKSAVGFSSAIPTIPGTRKADAVAQINSLKSLLTIENMGIMKGVLSDSDMKVIAAASSALTPTMSEQQFRTELIKIAELMQERIKNPVGATNNSNAAGNEVDGWF